jgi:hypothetical protein
VEREGFEGASLKRGLDIGAMDMGERRMGMMESDGWIFERIVERIFP